MEPISKEFVERIWKETAALTHDRADSEMRAMGKNQPDLLAFLVTFTEDLGQEAKELAVYLGFVVYRMFLLTKGTVPRITSRTIMASYNENARMLKGPEGAGGRIPEKAAKTGSSVQPHVMSYIIEAVTEGAEEGDFEPGGEEATLLMMLLKTEIEALDRSLSLSRSSRKSL